MIEHLQALTRSSPVLRWLRHPHRNANIIGFAAVATGVVLFAQDVQHQLRTVGALPAAVAGVVLVVAGLMVLVWNRNHQAIAVAGLVAIGAVVGVLLFQFTLTALEGRTSGLPLPIVWAYLALCATTAADLLSEWGERINTSTVGE